jgi:hypothetical protein
MAHTSGCVNHPEYEPPVTADHAGGLTVADVDVLTGDDMMAWIENPFMSPDMLAAKVCWWATEVSAALRADRDALRERVEGLADEQQRAGDRLIEKNQDRRSTAAEQRWTEGYSLRRSAARLRAVLDADPSAREDA